MADAISAVASLQLNMLQTPEVARAQVPIALQAQITNAQAEAVAAKLQEMHAETVLQVEEVEGHGVPDALAGDHDGDQPAYRQRRTRLREPVQLKIETVAAAHPRGVGALVDVSA